MERCGYYNGYSYMGKVGTIYMPFASEAEYHQYLDGEKPTGAVLKARTERMRKLKEFVAEQKRCAKSPVTYSKDGAYESENDMVSHPNHYQSASGLEVIDCIKAFTEDLEGIEAVDTANVIKYVCRWKKKNGLEDLEKAQWYLTDLIAYLKKKEDKNEH